MVFWEVRNQAAQMTTYPPPPTSAVRRCFRLVVDFYCFYLWWYRKEENNNNKKKQIRQQAAGEYSDRVNDIGVVYLSLASSFITSRGACSSGRISNKWLAFIRMRPDQFGWEMGENGLSVAGDGKVLLLAFFVLFCLDI